MLTDELTQGQRYNIHVHICDPICENHVSIGYAL